MGALFITQKPNHPEKLTDLMSGVESLKNRYGFTAVNFLTQSEDTKLLRNSEGESRICQKIMAGLGDFDNHDAILRCGDIDIILYTHLILRQLLLSKGVAQVSCAHITLRDVYVKPLSYLAIQEVFNT